MHDLLMRALDGAAADPVSQPQIFVIAHAGGVCAVVTDQRIQSLPQLRRLWTQPFQPRYDLLHLAGFEIDTDLADRGGVCAVVTDQRIQSLPQLRRLWTQPFQPRYDLLHLAGFEIDTDL